MSVYYGFGLLVFIVIVFFIIIRFIHKAVDRDFQKLARASQDPAYRTSELENLDSRLSSRLPVPDDTQPLPRPRTGLWRSILSILPFVGLLLLIGTPQAAPEERHLWLWGGLTIFVISTLCMLTDLRRHKDTCTAALLRARADLRRMDNNSRGAADDLLQLLRFTPWDDTAWAEMADDLAACGNDTSALEAVMQAKEIDPSQEDYHLLEASLALKLGKKDQARHALDTFSALHPEAPPDPRAELLKTELEAVKP